MRLVWESYSHVVPQPQAHVFGTLSPGAVPQQEGCRMTVRYVNWRHYKRNVRRLDGTKRHCGNCRKWATWQGERVRRHEGREVRLATFVCQEHYDYIRNL